MTTRRHDIDLSDLTWLHDSDPSAENLARAEKLRTMLDNRLTVVGGIISKWKKELGGSATYSETSGAQDEKSENQVIDGTVGRLFERYLSSPNYRAKKYNSRQHTDALCRNILEELKDKKIASITADDMRLAYAKWTARAATKGRGNGTSMTHALITQLRTVVNYGAKDLEDNACLRLSFILRTLRLKMVKHRQGEPPNEDQVRTIIRTAHEEGWHSIALAQAIQFECGLSQRDVIGEWVPIGEKGYSEIMHEGMKWLRGIRWNGIDENLTLTHHTRKGLKKISLKDKEIVKAELSRFNPLPRNADPVVIHDRTGLPWAAPAFRATWRTIARAAGVSDEIRNTDSRANNKTRRADGDASAQEAAQ